MTEGQPQDAIPPTATEQHIPVTDGDAETHVPIDVTTGQVNPGEEGRWDHDKAETLATVLKQEGTLDQDLEQHQQDKDYYLSDAHIKDNTLREETRVERLGARVADYEEVVSNPEDMRHALISNDNVEEAKADLAKAETELADKETAVKQEANEKIAKDYESVVRHSNYTVSPFEELYDTNPDVLANMSTSEFIGIGRELKKIDYDLFDTEDYVATADKEMKYVDRLLEEKQPLEEKVAQEILSTYFKGNNLDNDAIRKVRAEMQQLFESDFDISPRQLIESFKSKISELNAQLQERKAALEAQRTAFLEKYKPTPTEAPPNL